MNLKRILNLRDAGGYPAQEGKTFQKNLIYRSGQPDKGTPSDLKYLSGLGIKTIVDLRPEKEWVRLPKAISAIHRVSFQVDITGNTIKRLRPYLHKKNTEAEILKAVISIYREMVVLFKPHLPTLFELLAEQKNYPILFHCRGGKDRTGVIIALLQMIAGVSRENILENYLLTNEFLLLRAKKMVKVMNVFAFGTIPVKNYELAYAAREEYLNAFIDSMLQEYGSAENYLIQNKVPKEGIEGFKRKILNLVPSP